MDFLFQNRGGYPGLRSKLILGLVFLGRESCQEGVLPPTDGRREEDILATLSLRPKSLNTTNIKFFLSTSNLAVDKFELKTNLILTSTQKDVNLIEIGRGQLALKMTFIKVAKFSGSL